ncbi:hypothetical protein FHS78_003824 [Parvibaculum indicum]|uniref:TFIIB-type zinc ribbon-containing protein n=1 Tax=Parvibaculum indicum TaxID=562969 RepID=UPI003CCCDA39|nr:hypothetical protein [Parvibaculum indicum]
MSDTPMTAPQPSATGMLCPHCKIDLVMSDRQGIEIDYCPRCRGVWLDRGELDKIIEKSQEQAPGQREVYSPSNQDRYEGRRDSYEHRGGHRRKSWLSDLFD